MARCVALRCAVALRYVARCVISSGLWCGPSLSSRTTSASADETLNLIKGAPRPLRLRLEHPASLELGQPRAPSPPTIDDDIDIKYDALFKEPRLGMTVVRENGRALVSSVDRGGAAHRVGVTVGSLLVGINGKSVLTLDYDTVMNEVMAIERPISLLSLIHI